MHLGLITETFRVECVLTTPSSRHNFQHSFSFPLKSSGVALIFILLLSPKSFLFIISASLLSDWIFIVSSTVSCFFNFSTISLLMSLDFSSAARRNKNKKIALLLSIPVLL